MLLVGGPSLFLWLVEGYLELKSSLPFFIVVLGDRRTNESVGDGSATGSVREILDKLCHEANGLFGLWYHCYLERCEVPT